MSNTYITEAFKQFNLLDESEEFGMDVSGLEELNSFLDNAMQDEEEQITDVIDLEAEAKEDLKQSYIGKVILDCNVCHSNIFFNKDEVNIDEEGLVNVDTECPYCMSNDGYTIVGEIKPYSPEGDDEFLDDEEELADEPIEIEDTDEDEEPIEEGLKLDGVKELNGRKSLRRRPEHDGDKKLRGKNNTQLSGSEDLHESKLNEMCDENFEDEYDWVMEDPKLSDEEKQAKIDELEKEYFSEGVADSLKSAGKAGLAAGIRAGANSLANDLEEGCDKSIDESKDLTTTSGQSMAKLIQANHKKLDDTGTVQNLLTELEKIFNDAGYETKATKRLLANVKKQRDFNSALMTVYNSYLKGTGNGVIKNEGLESSLDESIQDVSITTDDETMTMTTKEDGGTVIETTPNVDMVDDFDTKATEEPMEIGDEMIAPIDDETKMDIESNGQEDEFEEEPMFDEEMPEEDIDMEDFDDEAFDELGESYLRRCYENVESFKTTDIQASPNQLMVEGLIKFNSGNTKKTQFVFESTTTSKDHSKVKFEGYNKQITNGKKAFKLGCSIEGKSLIPESLNYNYKSKNELNESVRVYGTIKKRV